MLSVSGVDRCRTVRSSRIQNPLPCVAATTEDIAKLAAAIEADPRTEITVDVENSRVTYGDESIPVHIPDSAREALVGGQWDPIAELLDGADEVAATASAAGYVS